MLPKKIVPEVAGRLQSYLCRRLIRTGSSLVRMPSGYVRTLGYVPGRRHTSVSSVPCAGVTIVRSASDTPACRRAVAGHLAALGLRDGQPPAVSHPSCCTTGSPGRPLAKKLHLDAAATAAPPDRSQPGKGAPCPCSGPPGDLSPAVWLPGRPGTRQAAPGGHRVRPMLSRTPIIPGRAEPGVAGSARRLDVPGVPSCQVSSEGGFSLLSPGGSLLTCPQRVAGSSV